MHEICKYPLQIILSITLSPYFTSAKVTFYLPKILPIAKATVLLIHAQITENSYFKGLPGLNYIYSVAKHTTTHKVGHAISFRPLTSIVDLDASQSMLENWQLVSTCLRHPLVGHNNHFPALHDRNPSIFP